MGHSSIGIICRRTVVLMLTTALLLCSCMPAAFAASGDDVLVVTIDECVANNSYMLLIVKPGTPAASIGEKTILYADQITASGGTIRAAIVFPDFSACDVFAGGDFANGTASPRKVASYKAGRTPTSTAVIEDGAFENTGFTHIYLSSRTESIGSRAFAACSSLVYIYIPASVTEIDGTAFSGSGNVTIGCQAGSAAYSFAVANSIDYVVVN
ncbi:MAG: leucine-rich repeat domain-containing protein [Oscillospiraceae bacterium]|nr:leucine-rich repeat domain-containing protein [Oscillospiraceae bacterium]